MADTTQGVRWALAQGCPLRQADEWSNRPLARAQLYSRHVSQPSGSFHNFEGVCVTSINSDSVPVSGFCIEEEFAVAGGTVGLHQWCGNCPANTALEGLAGCTGWISLRPYSEELDTQLRELVGELDLTAATARAFPTAALLWFSFWMDSPLSAAAMQVLVPLLESFVERHLSDSNTSQQPASSLTGFIRAMERAQYFGLDLRVEMMPLGHTDFGVWTTFAHCPRCKAGAPVEPWQKVRHAWLTCQMCGEEFDPAITASRQPMPSDSKDSNLLQQLGAERYRAFAIGYLVAHGRALAYATEVVDKHLAPPTPAQLEKRRQLEAKGREKRHFIHTVLYAGFERLQPTAETGKAQVSNDYKLTFEEAQLLLQRCQQWRAKIYGIHHHSQDDDLDGIWVNPRDFASPEAALLNLWEQGCHEFYSVGVGITDETLEIWKAQGG